MANVSLNGSVEPGLLHIIYNVNVETFNIPCMRSPFKVKLLRVFPRPDHKSWG